MNGIKVEGKDASKVPVVFLDTAPSHEGEAKRLTAQVAVNVFRRNAMLDGDLYACYGETTRYRLQVMMALAAPFFGDFLEVFEKLPAKTDADQGEPIPSRAIFVFFDAEQDLYYYEAR